MKYSDFRWRTTRQIEFAKTNNAPILRLLVLLLSFVIAPVASANYYSQYFYKYYGKNGAISFDNIANKKSTGLSYFRQPSASEELWKQIRSKDVFTAQDIALSPAKSRGIPGVALIDYDNDGDLDIYVTNGPGKANSLFENRPRRNGKLRFKDVAVHAGVDATSQDSTGVCFGDIDNDGDEDLYVLGKDEPNHLYENQGDGRFIDITSQSNVGAGSLAASTCSFGDVNGDGLLDVVVSNLFTGTAEHKLPIILHGFEDLEQHNQLFINQGGNVFVDDSVGSGINTQAGISWSTALVDYDLDGDLDLLVADDQGARQPAVAGGFDTGFFHILVNNGAGKFREVTDLINGGRFGAWMGMAFGDMNSDGNMDIFASNIGDYMALFMEDLVGYPVEFQQWSSGWFLGNDKGRLDFADGFGQVGPMPFGWGSAIVDYDNDGDQDVIYQGGLDLGVFVDASNPGAVIVNDGNNQFHRDDKALSGTDHSRRNVNGVAVGDLNQDGFVDIVSVSNQDWPSVAPLAPYLSDLSDPAIAAGGPFDSAAYFWPTFTPIDQSDLTQGFTWNGIEPLNGSLAVEMNNAKNRNKSVTVDVAGSKGLIDNGRVNRSGIGAVVTFKPWYKPAVMSPVVSGGTYASQHAKALIFGLGKARAGTVDIMWPGGVKNRLYNVRAGEKITFPEIPCSYDDQQIGYSQYKRCVFYALKGLYFKGEISSRELIRFFRSAVRAYGRSSLYGEKTQAIQFDDESEKLSFEHLTEDTEGLTGAAWFDYDRDGDLDLYLTNGSGGNNALFKNDGSGNFADVAVQAGVGNGLGNSGALASDIDNDGWPDLFLTSDGGMVTPTLPTPVKLYHNQGDGTFKEITDSAGITGFMTSFSSAFADINNDGYLDLLVSTPGSIPMQRADRNKMFLNNGDLTFTDISAQTGVDTALGGCLAMFTDYDLDGDQDAIIGNCNELNILPVPIELFRNDGNLNFTNVTQEAGLTRVGGWMGLAIADYDNDGDQDIFSSNLGVLPGVPAFATATVLYENNGDGTFTDVDELAGVRDQIWGWGATFQDFNNDGYEDIFYTGNFPFGTFPAIANPGTLYINNRDTTFNDESAWLGIDMSDRFTSGVAAADYNNDGFVDIVVTEGAPGSEGTLDGPRIPGHPILLTNKGNDYQSVTIETIGNASNKSGVGARIALSIDGVVQTKEVRAGSSFLSTEGPWPVFGVDKAEKIDYLKIYWPSGLVDTYENLSVGRRYIVSEGSGISEKPYTRIARYTYQY